MNSHLNIYDSLGNLMWTKESNAWQPFPLSDSLLLYFTLGELLVLEAKSGETRKDFSDEIGNKSSVFAYIAASENGHFFSIYGGTADDTILTSFSVDSGYLWAENFNISKEWIEESTLSPDGRFLGVIRRQRDKPKHWEIQFRDNFVQGKLVWKFEFEVERALTASSWKTVAIFDNFLTATIPSGTDYYYYKGITPRTRTKCIFYDPESGSTIDSLTINGFLTQVNSNKFGTNYFRTVYDNENKKIYVLRSR